MQQRNSLKVQKIQKTDSAFKSTLATFGKYGGFASRDKINFSSSKWIDVQSTALARRKVKCSDHLTNQAERPPKQAHTTEHDCSKSTQLSSLMPRGKARTPAPHNMTFCTAHNIRGLGKNTNCFH